MAGKVRVRGDWGDLALRFIQILSFVALIFSPFPPICLLILWLSGPLHAYYFLICSIAAYSGVCLFLARDELTCLVRGHIPRAPSSVAGFEGDDVIFSEECLRCWIQLDIFVRYDAPEFSDDRLIDIEIPDRVVREARIAVVDAIRRGLDPPQAGLRIYAQYYMTRQANRLRRLGLQGYEIRPSSADPAEVLRGAGVELDFKVSDRSVFQLLMEGGRLYVEAPHPLPIVWKERGVGLDIVELKVVEMMRNRHANRVIALIQLVGKPFPKSRPFLLDTVMVGRDASGPWLLRAPPRYWNMPLERQLSWTIGLRSGRRVREA